MVLMMVNKMIMLMVLTMDPIPFSANTLSINDKAATVINARKASPKADK